MNVTTEIMQNLPIMAFQYKGGSADFAFTYVSEGCERLTGYSTDEFTRDDGQKFISMVHADDLESFKQLHEATLDMGMPLETTFRIFTKSGMEKRIWVRTRVTDTDSAGMPYIYEGFFADITKQLRLETSKLANRAKYDFLARISHEIRTPMNAIIGMAELGLREDAPEKISDYTLTIKQAGEKLMSVLSDILDYAKIESGEMELNNEEYVLASMLHDVASIGHSWLADTDLGFDISIDRKLPNVLVGDMLKLRQVVLSILSNAVKFTEKGHIALTVTGDIIGDTINLAITISDTGRGIKEEDIENLFKEFTQFDEKSIEGTGLGLTITHNLVKLMDGNIQVFSVFGVGSIFIVNLPQKVKGIDEIGEIADILNGTRQLDEYISRNTTSKTIKFTAPQASILIVDDISTNLKVAKGLLQSYNMRTDLCISGAEAIELVKTNNYDLILMDHMMPVMNGVEATLNIRGLGKTVPIVALTANAVYGMREMFLQNGFDDFLSKPIDIVALNTMMEKWIPKEKQIPITAESTAAAKTTILEEVAIAGLDMQKGIEMTGGSEELYLGVLESFYENAQRLSKELQICADAGDTKLYAIHVHGIKSTSGTIGADEISQFAKALETAAVNDSLDFVRANNAQFLQNLAELLDNIYPLVMVELSKKVDKDAIQKALQQMKSALFSNNQADIDEQTKNLQQYLLAEGIGNQINKVLQNKMAGNFEAAISLIDTITEGATQ